MRFYSGAILNDHDIGTQIYVNSKFHVSMWKKSEVFIVLQNNGNHKSSLKYIDVYFKGAVTARWEGSFS